MLNILSSHTSALLVSLIVGPLPATQNMEVHLSTGGVRVGRPDPSTSEATLRLRVGDEQAFVVFGLPWQDITKIRYHGKVWEPGQFEQLQAELREQPVAVDISVEKSAPASAAQPPAHLRPLWQAPTRSGPSEPIHSRVRSIEIDVVAGHWDEDPEWDGLVVRVWPLDGAGQVRAVTGTLSVTLLGESYQFDSSRREQLGRWVRPVQTADYGHDGASFRLEFQHPDLAHLAWPYDPWTALYGDVTASFAIPGHGVFRAATDTPVRLRPFRPQRDRALLRIHSRSGRY